MGCDQLGRVLGVDEPGGVSAGHLIKPGAVYLVDRRPRALDGEVRVVGSDDEDRGCGNRGEFRGCEDTFGAWAGPASRPGPGWRVWGWEGRWRGRSPASSRT